MPGHDAASLTAFLRAVDTRLEEEMSLVVVGGAALLLAHGSTHATLDIDLFEEAWPKVEFLRNAAAELGSGIAIDNAAVADAPYDYDTRLVEVDLGLGHLHVLVPEAHDLAIMKALRANEHDLEGLESVHQQRPFDLDTLVERFWDARHAHGEPVRLRLNFLATIERLFGGATADEVEARIAGWPDRG